MTGIKERLSEFGLSLPELPKPVAAFAPAIRTGDLIFVSGQLPARGGHVIFEGRVDADVSVESAQTAAREAVLTCLTALETITDLEQIVQIVNVTGYVATSPNFFGHAKVMNGASRILHNIFGDIGRHSRTVVGVNNLPMNAPVQIDMVARVRDGDDRGFFSTSIKR